MQQAASPPASLVRIPFMGITAGSRSSRQPPTPQAAAAATVSVPSAYRSRLPPPPPVFKALTSRPKSGLLQSSSGVTSQSVNPSPWSPAVLKGVSNQANTLSKGQPAGSIPTFLRPPISQFHPATSGYAPNNASLQHQEQTSTSSRDAAGRSSSVNLSNGSVSSPVFSPSAAAYSDAAEEAAPEAMTSPDAQTASQMSLLDERQLIPGVSTGQTQELLPHTEALDALVKEREASLAGSPAQPKVVTSSLKELKESARLTVEADTPVLPLVFPWSQGPNSTGAASAYASLSDSYLSRPPSQTPSQAPSQGPSPSKYARHGVPSPRSPPQHPRRDAAFAASLPQRAQHDTELSKPYGAVTMPSSPDPPLHAQHTQQAVQMYPSTVSPLAESSPAAQPCIDTLTPSAAASPSVGPQSAQSLSKQADHLPEDPTSAAAQHGLQSAQLPGRGPQGAFTMLVQHTQQQQHQALHGQRLYLDASHQPGAMTQDAAEQLLQDTPPQLNTAQGSERLPLSDVPSANGFSNSQSDLVRVASSSSGNGSSGGGSAGGDASSVAADGLRQGIGRVPDSVPSLYRGLGSHASLAESLVNGTIPAKANNFTQLQQHIDDLTKEKFELVRGLKEQQKMAAGLSEENLLLTEDFN
ncbi:MAG: hypothetical protein FRX49_12956 [Trebouxia sp. A1-2]|nr:MAG: hypothetical protein FRX49_12956 [Trebouxia sp. A1-2]